MIILTFIFGLMAIGGLVGILTTITSDELDFESFTVMVMCVLVFTCLSIMTL